MTYSTDYHKYFERKKRQRENQQTLRRVNVVAPTEMSYHPLPSSTNASQEGPTNVPDPDTMDYIDVFNSHSVDDNSEAPSPSDLSSSLSGSSNQYRGRMHSNLGSTLCGTSIHNDSPSIGESTSFEVMSLLDGAGAPRYVYDDLIAIFNRQTKKGLEISHMMTRKTLMQQLSQRFNYPEVEEKQIFGFDVYKFPFIGMLQDLLDTCGSLMYTIDKLEDASTTNSQFHDLFHSPWIKDTFNLSTYDDFDSTKDIMLPLILYMDKTGTDALQRYSLEPVLFTTAAIPRQHRGLGSSWRHLGFIPPLSSSNKDGIDDNNSSNLQLYHNLLSILLEDIIQAQNNPPVVNVKRNGVTLQLRARLPIMIVMGDQKSQDTLCGRKHSNSGGAGRIHRSCMCSYLNADNPQHVCVDVCLPTIRKLTKNALITDLEINTIATISSRTEDEHKLITAYLKQQRKMNSCILSFPFTQHAIRNAFDPLDFGAWSSGIFTATFDDFMHSTEAGLFEYTSELVYKCMSETQNQLLEPLIQNLFGSIRSSVRPTYPRWRITNGFTRQTLMTCVEKVGNIMILALSLQYKEIAEIVDKSKTKQMDKYVTFCSKKPSSTPPTNLYDNHRSNKKLKSVSVDSDIPFEERNQKATDSSKYFWDKYMQTDLTRKEIEHRLLMMVRHGFDVDIISKLDLFQIHQLLSHCCNISDCEFPKDFPKRPIPNYYNRHPLQLKLPSHVLEKALLSFTAKGSVEEMFGRHRLIPVEGTMQKHYRLKPKDFNLPRTTALLSDDLRSVIYLMEYMLCFHAFSRYSHTLDKEHQSKFDIVDFGGRSLVQYFEKMMYRGDDTVDSRTTKVHANLRAGFNFQRLGSITHADCQTGERLLKTKAKGISSTAQQRGSSKFEEQTMHRIKEQTILSKYELYLAEQEPLDESSLDDVTVPGKDIKKPVVGRIRPHFRYDPSSKEWYRLCRKGKIEGTVTIDPFITKSFLDLEPNLTVHELYGEIILRDKSRVRATPDYNTSGPWYDYADVKWRLETGVELFPSRCLGFYYKQNSENNSFDLRALVHSSEKRSLTKCNHFDSILTQHFFLQYNKDNSPRIYSIPCEAIESTILCLPHDIPSNMKKNKTEKHHIVLFDHKHSGIMAVRPRHHWAYAWLTWNEILKESNSSSRVMNRRPYASYSNLANEHDLRKVRKSLKDLLKEITNKEKDETEEEVNDEYHINIQENN